jgi:hypothetical protein
MRGTQVQPVFPYQAGKAQGGDAGDGGTQRVPSCPIRTTLATSNSPPVATPYFPRRNDLIMLFQADGDAGYSFLEPGASALKSITAQRS